MSTPKVLHLRSQVKGKLPAPGSIQVGQIGVNYNAADPFVCIKDSNGTVRRLDGVSSGTIAPSTPNKGQMWVDNTAATPVLKLYDGTTWVVVDTVPVAATTVVAGVVQLATAADVTAGAVDRVVTAAELKTTNDRITTAAAGGLTGVVGTAPVTAVVAAGVATIGVPEATITTAGLLSAAEKVKLTGVTAGAEPNVQPNWTETDNTKDDFIKNKPATFAPPIASTTLLGGVKQGTGVAISADGTLSVTVTGGLAYKGTTDPTAAPPATPKNGDVYIASVGGAYNAGWGLTGTATQGGLLIYESSKWDAVGQASAPVKSDWNAAVGAAGEILHKPGAASTTVAGLMSATDKVKLDGVATGAEVNVQSDWKQTDNTKDDFIKNKPVIAAAADATATTKGVVTLADAAAITAGTAGRVVDAAQLKVVNDAIATATGGGITGLSGTAPITATGTGATRAIGIDAATITAPGSMSAADKAKLDGITAAAKPNVQANWTETDNTKDDFIKNKPTTFTPPVATASQLGGVKQGTGIAIAADGTIRVNLSGGLTYKGQADPTVAPPAGPAAGDVYLASKGGAYNAGWGLTGTATTGEMLIFEEGKWDAVGQATAPMKANWTAAAGAADEILNKPSLDWTRTGTTLAPKTAGDVVAVSAGTAALPGLTPVGDPNTGLYSPGADQVAISTGGTERVRIDPNGRLLVGTSSASTTPGSLTAKFQVQGTSIFDTGITNILWEASANPVQYQLVKSRGASIGTHTVVQDNDILGRILFGGSEGTDFETGAWIQCQVDGTPGLNDMPGRLVFSTTADGAALPTERMRISSDGSVTVSSLTGTGTGTVGVDATGKLTRTAAAAGGGGGISSLAGTAPVTVTGTGTSRTIAVTAATNTVAGLLSAADKAKLDGIAAGSDSNVQSDWNQADNTKDDFIKNKPTIPAAYTLPTASATIKGGVQVGAGLAVSPTGVLSNSYSYTLPAATAAALGGVKVGNGLSVTADGTLSVAASGALTFKGSKAPTDTAPTAPAKGDTYVMSVAGKLHASWTPLGSTAVALHEVVAWDGTEWVLLGSAASTAVTSITASAPLSATGTAAVALTVADATNAAKGVIRIATAAEATGGTLETVCVTPGQLHRRIPNGTKADEYLRWDQAATVWVAADTIIGGTY